MNSNLPDIIRNLPKTNLGINGVEAWLLQCEEQQVVFMEFDEDVEVPEHSHEAQWGVVLDGEIELCIGEETRRLKKGDSYFIPSGVLHSANIRKGYKDLTLFNQRDRYSAI